MTDATAQGLPSTSRPRSTWLAEHWLLACNALTGLTVGGAVLAPLLGALGWSALATLVYLAYRSICLQRPSHSFFILGYKLALEQRTLAIFGGLLLGGVLYAPLRDRLRPLGWRPLVLLNAPMLVDVLSQTVGLRDSTWLWRVATGLLGGLAVVWWAYPRCERAFAAERQAPAPMDEARRIVEAVAQRPPAPPAR